MYTFSNRAPDDETQFKYCLIRTPNNGSLKAIATSSDLLGLPTHFWGGRTVPCGDVECEPCARGVRRLWHGYLAAYVPANQRHIIFEMTAQASETFVAFRMKHNTLRGCMFVATRIGKARNGRVHIVTKGLTDLAESLAKPPDLVATLCKIWNVPVDECCLQGSAQGVPDLHVADPDAANRLAHELARIKAREFAKRNGNQAS